MISQKQYNLLLKNVRDTYVKIDLLNFSDERKIGEIQGVCISGSISVNVESNFRRIANISLVIKDSSFEVGEDKKFWIDKKIRISSGLFDYAENEIVWFNLGHYIINNPNISYAIENNTLSFEAVDYMALLDGTLAGSLQYITEIPVDTNISDSFRETADHLGGITKLNVFQIEDVTPYTIKKDATATVYDILKELNDLYMNWEFFFDVDGYLVFQKFKTYLNDPSIWDFDSTKKTLINYSYNYEFSNIKNVVQVWGKTLDNGTQIKYLVKNDNDDNPFSISKLGERIFTFSSDTIFTEDQAQSRAEYELMLHSNFNEKLTITCLPIHILDVNKIIEFKSVNEKESGKYLIQSLNIPLLFSEIMSIEAYRIYN